jgi:hypothetical protein
MAITERIADRYGLTVETVLCARWDRFAAEARAEIAEELCNGQGASLRAAGQWLGCSHTNVRKLLGCQKMRPLRADAATILALSRNEQARRLAEAEARARELERQMERLSGAHLGETFARAFAMPLRCGIVLAILAEHFPRPVRAQALIDFYDHACTTIGYGMQNGASADVIKKNLSSLKQAFAALGMEAPSEIDAATGQRRLTGAAAAMLHERFDAPRRSQMMLAEEARVPLRFTGAAA